MTMTNSQTYYNMGVTSAVKSVIVQAPGVVFAQIIMKKIRDGRLKYKRITEQVLITPLCP